MSSASSLPAMRKSILPAVWQVPQEFRDRLGDRVGRQRAMISEGHLLLVLHAPPKSDEEERHGRFFWRQPDGGWSSSGLGAGPAAVNKHINEYAEILEKYDQMEEQATTAEEYFAVVEAVAPLQRAARNMQAALQDARQKISQDRDLINLRDGAYEVERTAELLYQGAKNSLDFAVARRTEEQAQASRHMAAASHRLNLLAAFFFPIATLSAVFGMEIKSGLESMPAPFGFIAVLLVGLMLGGMLMSLVTKKDPS